MDERLRKGDWEVADIGISEARDLVTAYHYAKGASNTATYLHGLRLKGGPFVGVAWWIPPTRSAAMATNPENWKGVLALSRLVMSPGTPKNACSFLLARSAKLIPKRTWPVLVTYADTWRGHTGKIYAAANWAYEGLTKPEATFTLNGRMTSRKAGNKTRTRSEMEALGCKFEGRHAKHKYVLRR